MSSERAEAVDGDGDQDQDQPPRVYRCLECKTPIANLAIAARCEECGTHFGDDRYLIDSVDEGLLEELRDERDGCIACGADTEQVFCSPACSEDWFVTYTDAFLR